MRLCQVMRRIDARLAVVLQFDQAIHNVAPANPAESLVGGTLRTAARTALEQRLAAAAAELPSAGVFALAAGADHECRCAAPGGKFLGRRWRAIFAPDGSVQDRLAVRIG